MECVSVELESPQVPVLHTIETNPSDITQSVVTPVEQLATNSTPMLEEITDNEVIAKEILDEIISSSIQMLCSNTLADKLQVATAEVISLNLWLILR